MRRAKRESIEIPLTVLFTSVSIFFILNNLYPWTCQILLMESFIQLIWQTTVIMMPYSMGHLKWLAEGQDGDYFELEGGWMILFSGGIMILASIGTINYMMSQGSLF